MAKVTLTWVASTDTVDGYNVYRGVATGQETARLNSALVTALTYEDDSPIAGADFYVVKSSLGGVESVASNEVSVSVRPAAPTNLVAVLS